MASCTCVVTEIWANCQWGSWAPLEVGGGRRKGNQVVGVSEADSCGVKPVEVCKVSVVAVLSVGFFHG